MTSTGVCTPPSRQAQPVNSGKMSSSDMHVVVDQMPTDPVKPKPSKLPSWLQSKRNKGLAALGLLTLIAVPAIVAPVVVSQQKQQQQRNTVSPRDQQVTDEQLARNAAEQDSDPDDFVAVETPRRPGTTKFNATRFNTTKRRNGTSTRLKVPARSWALANKTRTSLTKPETWTPFVKIKDGQVGSQAVWVDWVTGGGPPVTRATSPTGWPAHMPCIWYLGFGVQLLLRVACALRATLTLTPPPCSCCRPCSLMRTAGPSTLSAST